MSCSFSPAIPKGRGLFILLFGGVCGKRAAITAINVLIIKDSVSAKLRFVFRTAVFVLYKLYSAFCAVAFKSRIFFAAGGAFFVWHDYASAHIFISFLIVFSSSILKTHSFSKRSTVSSIRLSSLIFSYSPIFFSASKYIS